MSIEMHEDDAIVVDLNGNHAHVSEEDAEKLMDFYELAEDFSFWNFDWDWKMLFVIISFTTSILNIVVDLLK